MRGKTDSSAKNLAHAPSLEVDESGSIEHAVKPLAPVSAFPPDDFDLEDPGDFSKQEVLQPHFSSEPMRYRIIKQADSVEKIRLKKFLAIIVMLGFFLSLTWYIVKKDSNINQSIQRVTKLFQKNLDRKGFGIYTKAYTEGFINRLRTLDGPGTDKSSLKTWREMDCRFLIQEAYSRKIRAPLDSQARYLLLSCLLFQDSPQMALRSIQDDYGDPQRIRKTVYSWDVLPELLAASEAQQNGESKQAETYLRAAAGLFPALFDPFLEREIFRARLFNAARSLDKKSFQAIWKTRPITRMEEDEKAFLDVNVYRVFVLKPNESAAALSDFFSKPESVQRFQYDAGFIRMIVEQSIRWHLTSEGVEYLDRLIGQRSPGKSQDGEWLPLLRARLLLAEHRYSEVLDTLKPIENFAVRSQEYSHIKGAAILSGNLTKNYQLMAAAEFQKAVNIEPRAEHFMALIMAFIDAHEIEKADKSMKFWGKIKVKQGDEAWRLFAEGLLKYARGNRGGARQTWAEIGLRYPSFELASRVGKNLDEDPKYLENQMVSYYAPDRDISAAN
ncbi:MAG: hypothetical protein NTX25_01345 [Proteobacteria bacterium]|nr:hypothetical protein [Pseudomonadota bacterium]